MDKSLHTPVRTMEYFQYESSDELGTISTCSMRQLSQYVLV